MAPSNVAAAPAPKIIFLADSFAHGQQATTARQGDFLGVVGTHDTFVRSSETWRPIGAEQVQRSFDEAGCIGVQKVPRGAPPPYVNVEPNAANRALTSAKGAL